MRNKFWDLRVSAKIGSLRTKLRFEHNIEIPNIEVMYWQSPTRICGFWRLETRTIWLHNGLLCEYGLKYIDEVVAHEFAHAVVDHLYPDRVNENGKKIRHHGKEFREVCKMMGFEGRAKTILFGDSHWIRKIKRIKRIEYKCSCRNGSLSMIKHNRIVNKTKEYKCKMCKEVLQQAS